VVQQATLTWVLKGGKQILRKANGHLLVPPLEQVPPADDLILSYEHNATGLGGLHVPSEVLLCILSGDDCRPPIGGLDGEGRLHTLPPEIKYHDSIRSCC